MTKNHYFDWECEGLNCTVKLRVKLTGDNSIISALDVQCPICMTKQIPPIFDGGGQYGFQFNDGSGWKDAPP